MGNETVASITENIERALKGEGLNVVRKTLDLRGSLPAGMMPLAQVSFKGESFENTFAERPSRSEAAFSLKIIIPERPDRAEAREEQMCEIDQYQGFLFDPTAARNLDLPAEEACAGALILIANKAGGAYTLTVRNDAGGTVIALTQNQVALLFCDGTAWSEITS